MARLYVTEYATLSINLGGRLTQVPEEPPLATQLLDTTGGATASAAFNAKTRLVRLHCDNIVSFLFGTSPTATTTDSRMASGTTEYHGINPVAVTKVSAITNT